VPAFRSLTAGAAGIAVVYIDGDITDGKSQSVPFNRSLAGGGPSSARSPPRAAARASAR
jgi:hypothetical protein